MVSRFKIVDEEYIEELKDKGENENTKNSTVKKWANERNEFRSVRERCPRPTTVAVLGIQKFSN